MKKRPRSRFRITKSLEAGMVTHSMKDGTMTSSGGGPENGLLRLGWDDVFFQHQLHAVGDGLKQAHGAGARGA